MSKELIYITLFIILVLASPMLSIVNILKIIRIRRTTTSWISSLPSEGQVEVVGNAKDASVQSPYSKRDCLVWKVKVEEKHKSAGHYRKGRYDPGHEYWSTVYENNSSSPFIVQDVTGEIPVSTSNYDWIADSRGFDAVTADERQQIESGGKHPSVFRVR
jgi:hypothetical protein